MASAGNGDCWDAAAGGWACQGGREGNSRYFEGMAGAAEQKNKTKTGQCMLEAGRR